MGKDHNTTRLQGWGQLPLTALRQEVIDLVGGQRRMLGGVDGGPIDTGGLWGLCHSWWITFWFALMRIAGDECAGVAAQEVKVNALVGLHNMLDIETGIAAFRVWGRGWLPIGATTSQLVVGDIKV